MIGRTNAQAASITIKNQDKTITANGQYTADAGYTGLGTINVNVDTGGGDDELLKAMITRGSYTNLVIPDWATSIGDYAFAECRNFTGTINISNNVTNIGTYAFRYCINLTGNLVLPINITNIELGAFFVCSGFTGTLAFPGSITSLGQSSFYGCSGFTKIIFNGQAPTINSTFSACTSVLEYDFTNCTSVPTLSNTNAFSGINANCVIKVPSTLYDTWIAATNWSTYASYIVAV